MFLCSFAIVWAAFMAATVCFAYKADRKAKYGIRRFKFVCGDRVRYYGAFNEFPEVSNATVTSLSEGDLYFITLDRSCCNDTGEMRSVQSEQWAHVKQLRRLKKNTGGA